MPQMKTVISVPKGLDEEERIAIAEDIVEFIITRTGAGLDRYNRKFKKYSKEYAREKGVSPGDVDLIVSGDLLDSLLLLDHSRGEIVIGYEEDDEINGKAEGNITGSYGQPEPNPRKARDYLGISTRDLAAIIARHKEE